MILMLAPGPNMLFGSMPSGSTYVSDQNALMKVTNNSVADQTALAGAGCYTLTPFGGWGSGMIDTLADLYAADAANGLILPGQVGFPRWTAIGVFNDGDNNGTWAKSGAGAGAGNWTQVSTSTVLSAAATASAAAAKATTQAGLAAAAVAAAATAHSPDGEAAYSAVTKGQAVTTFAPVAPQTGPVAPAGYALFNIDAHNTGATRAVASLRVFLLQSGSFDVLISANTDTTHLQTGSRFTVTTAKTGDVTLIGGTDFPAIEMPSGATLGAMIGTGAGAAQIATVGGAGSGWLYFNGDPGAGPQAYNTYQNQLQLTATLLPSVAETADAEIQAVKDASLANDLMLPTGASVVRETLGVYPPTAGANDAGPIGTRRTLILDAPSLGGVCEEIGCFVSKLFGVDPRVEMGHMVQTAANSFRPISRFSLKGQYGLSRFVAARGDFAAYQVPAGARQYISVPPTSLAMPTGGPGTGQWYVDNTDPGQPGDPAVAYSYAQGYFTECYAIVRRAPVPPNPALPGRSKTQLDASTFAGSALPAGWTAPGWTVNNGLFSPAGGQGYSPVAYSNLMFACEERTTIVDFQLTAANSYVAIGWRGAGTSVADTQGSMVAIDVANNRLVQKKVWNAAQNGADPGDQAYAAVPWNAWVLNRTYRLILERKRRVSTYTLIDTVTGQKALIADSAYTGAVNYNTLTGEQIGTLAFLAVAGAFTVQAYRVLSSHAAPRLWIGGDSLTEGLGVTESQRFAGRLRDLMLARGTGCVISGLTSDFSVGGVHRLTSEVLPLAPTLALFMFGTNDQDGGLTTGPNYQANATAFHDACVAAGIVPVFEIPAPCANHTFTQMHAWLLSTGWRLFRSDLAMSVNNDGVTQNAALFQSDGIHRNADGGAAMMARVAIDIPEVLE